MSDNTPYIIIGKEEGVRALASAFYDAMDELEEAESVREMHKENLDLIKQKLFEYLNGWLGGPHLYKDKYGSICLTDPHQPYPIGEEQRDQWITCWDRALEIVDAPDEFREMTREPIQRMASLMVNT
ncbi:MAG: globin [Chromatiales bacterium]|jgi:hemoglobin|nr:globin [Chromatiales bacterium]MDP6150431.1 group II truncated hemoglobin [Gammaproteobacteria bacterium]MDP7094202.1 group II truncated hemoglobin [Gammaproteobacteria bacterium]MDP7271183.1 group II truncated hemoglobin [Gammaproteobacteria bacterium]HJP04612.1 group II truncated hemoglobin [Gammaproteobacteria bacterium]